MTMMWPLPAQDKGLDVVARLAELTGVVEVAARDGLPAHVLEQSLWRHLLRLGHDLQAAYFALAGDGDCGPTLQLADGRVVKRLPEPHCRAVSVDLRGVYSGAGGLRHAGKRDALRRRRWMRDWACPRTGARICCGTGIRPWWWRIPTAR